MKKCYSLLLAVITLLTTSNCFASGGPDAYGYTWKTSLDVGGPTYNWIDITTKPGVQTVTGLADDNSAASMINIGFNFHYYWSDYSQLKVGSNGWLSFNNVSNVASCFPTIPTAGGAGDNILAMLMSDLNFTGAGNPGQVQYWSNNIDSCVVSYINVPYWTVSAPGWTGSNNFQAILCAADSSITFQYGSLSNFNNNAACVDMTVGMENSTGAIGLQVHSDAMPPSNYAIRFEYPDVVLLSIQDLIPKWNDNTENRAQFIPNNVSQELISNIANVGNTAVSTNIDLQANITNSASTNVHSSSGTIPTMAAGDDSTFTFPAAWTPSTTGQYAYQTTITNSQDINAANNTRTTEFEVVDICAPSMTLSYVTGNTPTGTLNWNGGANDDGAVVYFAPPVYPYTVSSLQYYIVSNVNNGFTAQIYDDNGPNGTQGTLLFTTDVLSGSVVTNAWNTVTVPTPVTLNDGGFYVVWLQGGANIFLGTETTAPLSNRNYEILDGGWAEYRETATKDICIRASITGYATTPVASYTQSANQLTVDFTNTSTGMYQSWAWDFGDGNTSTAQNPTHTYATAGTYNVCLITTTPCGADTFCFTLTTCVNPSANFNYTPTGFTTTFTDLSSGDANTWFWDFGNGNSTSDQNPTVTMDPGLYTVCLTVTNSCGYSSTLCETVTVCPPLMANFNHATNGLQADFTNLSMGVTSWSWDFGDGNTSTDQDPSHTYATPGLYNVCLTVTNLCGETQVNCHAVTVCELLDAEFNHTESNLDVNFTNASTGGGSAWEWTFGDGNSSTLENPTHTYANAGTYNVCMIVHSCTSDTMCHEITVCDLPFADYTYIDNNNWTLDFTDQSSSAVSWTWDFGDGNTSTAQNPSHTYADNGDYTVCLTILNACGVPNTSCQNITVLIWGIDENARLVMNGYPNPTTGILSIDFTSELNDVQVEVTDVTGKVIWTKEHLSGTSMQIDASMWAAGAYKVRVSHASGIGMMTLIKQ